jgi:hypothetical protein
VELPPRKALHIVRATSDRDDALDDILETDGKLSVLEENARLRRLVVDLSTMVLRCISIEK